MADFHISGTPPNKKKQTSVDFTLEPKKVKSTAVKKGDFHITSTNEKHSAGCASTVQYTPLNLAPVHTCSCGITNTTSGSGTPQTLSLAGYLLHISDGNSVLLPNEWQTLTLDGNDLSIGPNGNTITLPITPPDGNGIYTGSDTIPVNTLATVTPDPEGDGGDFAIGTFPDWPSINLTVPTKGLYFAENLYGEVGLLWGGNGFFAASSGSAITGGTQRINLNNLGIRLNFGPYLQTGSGSPEGVVTATPGSLYFNISGGVNSHYFKQTGSGNTGWVALSAIAAADGNGIYTGSGTSPNQTLAQVTLTSPFNPNFGLGVFPGWPNLLFDTSEIGIVFLGQDLYLFAGGTYTSMQDNGAWGSYGGSTNSGAFEITSSGTVSINSSGVSSSVSISANDLLLAGAIRLNNYPSSLNSAGSPVNVLTTDASGNLESHTVAEVVSSGGGVTGTGTADQITLWSGTSALTGNSAYTYDLTAKALELNADVNFNIHRGRLVFGGEDNPSNNVNSKFRTLSFGNSIRTTNTGQGLSYINVGEVGTTITPVFYVDHNNTTIQPFVFSPPTVTIAGGVTGTLRNNTVLINGASGFFSSLGVGASGASYAATFTNTNAAAIQVNNTSGTNLVTSVIELNNTPSVNGVTKQSISLVRDNNTVGNGTGISFALRQADNGQVRSSLYASIVDNTTSASIHNFIFEPLTGGAAVEAARITNRSIGINLGAQPAANLHVRGSGSTSATWTAQFHNSTGTNNALMVRDDGRVGILNAAPASALHVIGEGRFQTTSGVGAPLTVYDSGPVLRFHVNPILSTSIAGVGGQLSHMSFTSGNYTFHTTVGSLAEDRLHIRNGGGFDVWNAVRLAYSHGSVAARGNLIASCSNANEPASQIRMWAAGNGGVTNTDIEFWNSDLLALNGVVTNPMTQKMVIKTDGKVGIATASPQQTLHVAGTMRLTGSDGTATTIMGRDADGDISAITVSTGLDLTGGVLTATGSSIPAGTPSVVVDAFAGTGATATVSGNNGAFEVTLNTGTGAGSGGGKLFQIVFSSSLSGNSVPVFSAGDDAGVFAAQTTVSPCYIANADANDFELWTTGGFLDSTTYKINFKIGVK